jgi:hypothetical protein
VGRIGLGWSYRGGGGLARLHRPAIVPTIIMARIIMARIIMARFALVPEGRSRPWAQGSAPAAGAGHA